MIEHTFDRMVLMKTYNERITSVRTGRVGQPISWLWRDRRYEGGRLLDLWVTSGDGWYEDTSFGARPGRPQQVQHWLMEITNPLGLDQVELTQEEGSTAWHLVRVLD